MRTLSTHPAQIPRRAIRPTRLDKAQRQKTSTSPYRNKAPMPRCSIPSERSRIRSQAPYHCFHSLAATREMIQLAGGSLGSLLTLCPSDKHFGRSGAPMLCIPPLAGFAFLIFWVRGGYAPFNSGYCVHRNIRFQPKRRAAWADSRTTVLRLHGPSVDVLGTQRPGV